MISAYVAPYVLLVWTSSTAKVSKNICEYSRGCKRYTLLPVKNTKNHLFITLFLFFCPNLWKHLSTYSFFLPMATTFSYQMPSSGVWWHTYAFMRSFLISCSRMVFASHAACFPLGTRKKNSWELSKTLRSFFKHPFLKLSFYTFPQTSWDKFFPLFIS